MITSRDNEQIKQLVKLQSSAKRRKEAGLFVIEGLRLCRDAVDCGMVIQALYLSETAAATLSDDPLCAAGRLEVLADHLFDKISDTVSPQGVLCVCEIPEFSVEIKEKGKYLLLEDMSNPQNLGAIARTAEAFAFDGLFLSPGCCDRFSPKALRASMGAFFRLAVMETDLSETARNLIEHHIPVYAAVPSQEAIPVTAADFSKGAALAIGNEGEGLTGQLIQNCSNPMTIPMPGRAESLNAAAAAAILIWEAHRGTVS